MKIARRAISASFVGMTIIAAFTFLTPTSSLTSRVPKIGKPDLAAKPVSPTAPVMPKKHQVMESYGNLPLIFEANHGQTDPSVKFLSDGKGVTQTLASTALAVDGRRAEIPLEVRQLMEAKRYEIRETRPTSSPSAYRAFNPAHGMYASFSGKGFSVTPLTQSAKPWQWGMSLRDYGYGARLQPVRRASLVATGNRIEYRRGNLIEWYVNRAVGLEQGFTIVERPAIRSSGQPLRLRLALSGSLHTQVNADAGGIALVDADGRQVLAYAHLVVTDRAGQRLSSHFEVAKGTVSIVVTDAGAIYPVTVDPTLTQQAYLKASNTGTGDFFGHSVAVSDDTVVIGAYGEASNATGVDGNQSDNSQPESGAVYVFVRSGETWSQQAYLKASNTGGPFGPNNIGDRFGHSVAISGDIIVVGAPFEDSNATGVNGDQGNNLAQDSGAAYVFVRSNGTWSQQAYLKASNNGNGFANNDYFGTTVAVSGDTIVVGAPEEDSDARGVNGNQGNNSRSDSGAAYVFLRTGGTWSQQAYLKASNADNQDYFGRSVAISGDSIVVGARNESSNATGVDGNQADNSANASGAAYVFVRNDAVWSQEAYLKASNTGFADLFGESVAISGDTVVVGAAEEDSNATGVNGNQSDNSADAAGAAYVFERTAGVWAQQAYLKASNTELGDAFGGQVAVSGNMVVVGARFEDSNATCAAGNQSSNSAEQAGAAYVFVRSGETWVQQTYLKASNTEGVDLFGESVAISGDTVVVGAALEDSNATGVNGDQSNNSAFASGAVYVYGPSNQPPVARCRNVIVSANSTCMASVSIDNGSSDPDCDTIALTQSPPGPYPLGDTTVTLTVTDSNGATNSCSAIVTVTDNTPPVPNLATLPTITGECSATVTVPTATDNCTGQVTGTTTDPTSYNSQGTFTVHWTYDDGHGNTSTQTQTVVVHDTTAPVPNVASLPTVTGECSASIAAPPAATDNCAGQVTGTTTDPTSYTTQGTFMVHWTYDDGHGNTSTQTQTVIVHDTTAPVPNVASLPTVTGECSASIASAPTATDNCAGQITGTTTDPTSYTTQGTFIVHWTYSDGNGNTSMQTQTVTVHDTTAPAPNLASLPTVTGECSVTVTAPTATDNCAGQVTGTTADPTSYNSPGTFTIHWSYADGHGNTSTQTQTVVVHPATIANAGPDQAFCETTMATVAGNTPTAGTGTWTVLTGTAIILDPHNPAAVATNLSYGANVFRWTISNGLCSSTDDVVITRNSCPTNLTLSSNRDSFLRSGADDTNEGANERLRIQSSGSNRVVVGFDLTGISTVGLQSATLILNIAENSNNWGASGRLVDAHRLLVNWTEGNGRNDVMVGGGPAFRGTGEGVTWHCGKDTNIANQIANCGPLWNGGSYAAATAPGVLHTNGLVGQVSWDVTADVLAGANFGWTIKKREEGQNGQVRYYSREGAALAGNASLAPRLVLVYTTPPPTSGNRAYVTNYGDANVSVIDTTTNTVVATVPVSVGDDPYFVAVNPAGTRAYVTNSASTTVSVIDTGTNTVVATVTVGSAPNSVKVNSAGTRTYVVNYGSSTVSVIDTATNTVLATVPVGFAGPGGLALNPAGTRAYVGGASGNTVSVIDTTTNSVVATVTVGSGPGGMAVNPAGTLVYVTNTNSNTVSVIDTVANTVVSTLIVGLNPGSVAINSAGTRAYVANYGSNNVSVIDTATGNVLATVTVGSQPYDVAVNPSGTRVYVPNIFSNNVSVIDTATNTVVAIVIVGAYPTGVAVK